MPGFETGWMALGVTLLFLAIAILLKARQWQQASRLPEGEIVYSDMGAWMRQRKPLFDPYLGLAGRPDYLIEQEDGSIVPVEVKSSAAPAHEPYDGHVMQLAAYCLLVQATYGLRPAYGVIQYRDRAYKVSFTSRLERDVLDLLDIMRLDAGARDVSRDHENWRRCAGCGHLGHCGQALTPLSSTVRAPIR